ncbi:unnamed protein product [Trifolium pratense]|uniref:Uncharacterized protein n=1 Tax=Trifolium pratense TaxID=57577 RepID=A0ACB0JRU8_TRIPR|nr:unnamed protein product [Trifolium pratense]
MYLTSGYGGLLIQKKFSIKRAYSTLTHGEEDEDAMMNNKMLVWYKVVPLKVFVFVWQLLANRIPTRVTLFKRRIVIVDAQNCALGCDSTKSLSHLFFI